MVEVARPWLSEGPVCPVSRDGRVASMKVVDPGPDLTSDQLAERLLSERESQGLAWAARARLGYLVLGGVLAPLTRGSFTDLVFTEIVILFGVVLSFLILREAERGSRLTRAAMAGIVFDILAFFLLPISWYHAMPEGTPAVFVVKARADNIALVLAAVNALCLRPAYPLIVALAAALQRVACLAFALADPATQISWDPVENHLQGGLHPMFFVWDVLSIVIIGVVLAVLAGWARRTVRQAVATEAQNWQLREEQAQLVADAKVTGMSELVAGVAHELNTPLGAARSGFDSVRRAATKLAEGLSEDLGPTARARLRKRVLPALEASNEAAVQGLQRIASLMRSLRDFSRLDPSEAQPVDLHTGLDAAVDLIPPHLLVGVDLVRDYGQLPSIICRPAELNQVFMTVVTNACEAVAGRGRVVVRTRTHDGCALVEVEDDGCGIPPDRLAGLFEVGFGTKDRQRRIGLRLGLPIARRVLHQHGGSISIRSKVGEGTCLSMRLPLERRTG